MRFQSPIKDWAILAITGNATEWILFLKVIFWKIRSFKWFFHPLFWLYGSLLISYSFTVWFPLKRNSPGKISGKRISFCFSDVCVSKLICMLIKQHMYMNKYRSKTVNEKMRFQNKVLYFNFSEIEHRKWLWFYLLSYWINWALTQENLTVVCEQKCRPACASAQSDQCLCYLPSGKYYEPTCY